MKKWWFCLLLLLIPLFYCAAQTEVGFAGRLSSTSGSLSAAHVSVAPGTRIKVTNLETNRSIVVVVSRRLSAESGHLVELTVPAAESIGLRDEARVMVEVLDPDETPTAGTAESGGDRGGYEAARQNPNLSNKPKEGTPRKPVVFPSIRPESEPEDDPWGFYYTNSFEGEYPGDLEDLEPPPLPVSDPPPGGIIALPPEPGRAQVRPEEAAPPSPRTRPVPPPPPEEAVPAQDWPVQPAQTRVLPPPPPPEEAVPAQDWPVQPAQTRALPPPPPAEAAPAQDWPVQPAQTLPPPPPAPAQSVLPPAPERTAPSRTVPPAPAPAASVRLALPADTDRVVLSMDRDESGKLWVHVESETAREATVTEVPRPEPIQMPAPAQPPPPAPPSPVTWSAASPQTPPPAVQPPPLAPPPQNTATPPPPSAAPPERRRVTVTVIPRLPPPGDGKRYTLQVGSYRDRALAEHLLFSLQNSGIAAILEPQGANIRVIITGVSAETVPSLAEKLGQAGVTEIWVRDH